MPVGDTLRCLAHVNHVRLLSVRATSWGQPPGAALRSAREPGGAVRGGEAKF